MIRRRIVVVFVTLFWVGTALAADPLPLASAQGTVDKGDKESLTIRPRGPDGRFAKSITLRLTGTSRITTLGSQMRSGKVVVVQRDTDAKDLQSGQTIMVIYTTIKEGPVLLTAVVQPADEK